MTERTASTPEADRQIVMSRLVDAPRELVWKALSDPAHLVQWWGPSGFTNTFQEMDFRPGGVWRFTMHGPDGTNYPNYAVFEEITEPERISYWHGTSPEDARHFFQTLTMDEDGGKTLVSIRLVFDTVEACQKVKSFGIDGGQQTLARLDSYLQSMA